MKLPPAITQDQLFYEQIALQLGKLNHNLDQLLPQIMELNKQSVVATLETVELREPAPVAASMPIPAGKTPIPAGFPENDKLFNVGIKFFEDIPRDIEELIALPKIGEVKARAILTRLKELGV